MTMQQFIETNGWILTLLQVGVPALVFILTLVTLGVTIRNNKIQHNHKKQRKSIELAQEFVLQTAPYTLICDMCDLNGAINTSNLESVLMEGTYEFTEKELNELFGHHATDLKSIPEIPDTQPIPFLRMLAKHEVDPIRIAFLTNLANSLDLCVMFSIIPAKQDKDAYDLEVKKYKLFVEDNLNSLNCFAMHIITKVAEGKELYNPCHQLFIRFAKYVYPIIAGQYNKLNVKEVNFQYIISLYNIWNTRMVKMHKKVN